MTARERTRIIHNHLFSYREDKIAVAEFEAKAQRQMRKYDAPMGRGAFRSDPTARGGVMLAELPKRVSEKLEWIAAIEGAWCECVAEDNADRENLRGLAYVMEHYYCLTGEGRAPVQNEEARAWLCEECGISRRTFFAWLDKIADIVAYHAARRNLI